MTRGGKALASMWGIILLSGAVSSAVSLGLIWWKNTVFVDKLTYQFKIDHAYNQGRGNERLCTVFRGNNRKLNPTQEEFCKQHDNYKDHPKEF